MVAGPAEKLGTRLGVEVVKVAAVLVDAVLVDAVLLAVGFVDMAVILNVTGSSL